MSIISDNIRYLRKKNKMSQPQLADKVNRSESTIQMWETDLRSPTMGMVTKLADIFNIDINSLVYEDLEKGIKNKSGTIEKTIGIRIPLLGEVPCGVPIEAIETIIDYEEITEAVAKTGTFFALKAKGDSMYPEIKEGDTLIIKQTRACDSGDIAIVKINGDDATCKKVIIGERGITLVSLNSKYEPILYTPDEIRDLPITICGKVVESKRSY